MPGFTGAALGSAGRRAAGMLGKSTQTGLIAGLFFGTTNNATSVSRSFVTRFPGLYTFRLWGPGGGGGCDQNFSYFGGSAGGFTKKTIRLPAGLSIPVVCGNGGLAGYYSNAGTAPSGPTTVTLPSGLILSAGAGQNGLASNGAPPVPGMGSGGDVNLAGGYGSAPGSTAANAVGGGQNPGVPGTSTAYSGGGGSAPGDGFISGGNGGNAIDTASGPSQPSGAGIAPGAGGAAAHGGNGNAQYGGAGAPGLVIATYEGP